MLRKADMGKEKCLQGSASVSKHRARKAGSRALSVSPATQPMYSPFYTYVNFPIKGILLCMSI